MTLIIIHKGEVRRMALEAIKEAQAEREKKILKDFNAKTQSSIFFNAYVRNGFKNMYRAALEAGYSETTARAQGRRILNNAIDKMIKTVAAKAQ